MYQPLHNRVISSSPLPGFFLGWGANQGFGFSGGGKALMLEERFLGGLGAFPPQKILNFRCSEIASGAI